MELNKQALVMTSFCEAREGSSESVEEGQRDWGEQASKPVVACAQHGNQHEKWADDGSEP